MPRPKKEIKPQPKAEPVIKVTEEIIEDNKNQITIKVIPPKNEKGLMPCRKCNSYNLGQTYLNDIHEDAMIFCHEKGRADPKQYCIRPCKDTQRLSAASAGHDSTNRLAGLLHSAFAN